MDLLRNMKIFVRIADTASFTLAARQLDIPTGQASRAISELEMHLQTRLLNRTTRRVALTDAGNRYLQKCNDILALINASEAEAGAAQSLPSGVLRIHAPLSFGQIYVIPALAQYLETYPEVCVDLTLSQETPDLIDEGYDVTLQITTSHLPDSSLVAAPIGTMSSVLCSSPAYVARAGIPQRIDDLASHSCLQLATPYFPVNRWTFMGPDSTAAIELPSGRLRVNSPDALANALSHGLGIGPLPLLSALSFLASGELVRVLPDFELQRMTIYALYASREYLDAKIKAWIQCLRETIAAKADTLRLASTPL